MNNHLNENEKVGISGYLWLLFMILVFSGIFAKFDNGLQCLDFTTWVGQFGTIAPGAAPGIMGENASGASQGLMQTLMLAPTVITAVAFTSLFDRYGGTLAASKLFSPISKPLVGIRGACAVPFILNMETSDAAAAMLKIGVDNHSITPRERNICAASHLVAPNTIPRTFSNLGPLLPFVVISPAMIILIMIVMKIVAANFMRFYLNYDEKRLQKKTNEDTITKGSETK